MDNLNKSIKIRDSILFSQNQSPVDSSCRSKIQGINKSAIKPKWEPSCINETNEIEIKISKLRSCYTKDWDTIEVKAVD